MAVGSVAVLVGWLIVTVLTLTLGVLCLYAALLVLLLAVAGFVIDPGFLGQNLQHPVGLGDYVTLAWVASTKAMIGGALGSGLESNQEVREAAYGYRQRRRTEREDERTDDNSS